MHLVACLWVASSSLEIKSHLTWIQSIQSTDEKNYSVYVSAMYWAIVTCTTVGYGDIVPINTYEKTLSILILILGVAFFSFILSDLATQFSEKLKSSLA